MEYQKLEQSHPVWNNILEECKKESLNITKKKNEKNENKKQQIYQKLREEIEDSTKIKQKIAKTMSDTKTVFWYFVNKQINDDEMHIAYDIIKNKYVMSCNTAKIIFETNKYGDKPLLNLLREIFPAPIKTWVTYAPDVDSYAICISWGEDDTTKKQSSNCNCTLI